MPVTVDKEICIGCGACVGVCPTGAMTLDDDGKAKADPEVCVDCGACLGTCPMGAISEQ